MNQVWVCMATTLDGKISTSAKGPPRFTSREDRRKLFRLRAESDVLLVGAGTVRHEELPPLVRDEALIAARRDVGKSDHPAVAILSQSLDLPWRSGYFQKAQQDIYVMTDEASDDQRAQAREAGVRLVELGAEDLLSKGIARLHDLGHAIVMGEGGGGLNHALLREGLVDRLYLTIAPLIAAGRDLPVLSDGPPLSPPAWFELINHHLIDSELHLIYEKSVNRLDASD